jgi:hypothetical protein
MKTLLGISLLAIVSLALLAPAVAQDTPGLTSTWTIALATPTPDSGEGTAQFITFIEPTPTPLPAPTPIRHGFTRFIVQCDYVKLPNLTPLDVYVGPGTTPNEPYGKLVGRMHVVNGSGSLLLSAARAPFVTKGTTVSVMTHEGTMIMSGRF